MNYLKLKTMFRLYPMINDILRDFILLSIKTLLPKIYQKYNLEKYEFKGFKKGNTETKES